MFIDKPSLYLTLAWGIVVCTIILSLLPASSLPKINWGNSLHIDKIIHFGFYSSAAWSFSKYYKSKNSIPDKWLIGISLLLMGIILECLQYLMKQGRSFDLMDILANGIGVLFGLNGGF